MRHISVTGIGLADLGFAITSFKAKNKLQKSSA